MNKFKEGDIVTIKNLDWYNANRNEGGYVGSVYGICHFTQEMSKFCGKTFKIKKVIHENNIWLEDDDNKLIYYMFHPDWFEDTIEQPQEVKEEEFVCYKVTLEKAKQFWNSENSILQEIAMECYPMEKLAEE